MTRLKNPKNNLLEFDDYSKELINSLEHFVLNSFCLAFKKDRRVNQFLGEIMQMKSRISITPPCEKNENAKKAKKE